MTFYYENKVPVINDIVIVTLKNITENNENVYCNLIEYAGMEGFIISSELPRKAKPNKLFKHKELYPVLVTNVDKDKNTVDLSYKKVSDANKKTELIKYKARKKLYNLCLDATTVTGILHNDMIKYTFWKFMKEPLIVKDVQAFYDACLENPSEFTTKISKKKYKNEIEMIIESIKSRVIVQSIKAIHCFELIVYDVNAVSKIRHILTTNHKSLAACDELPDYEINFVGASKYSITTKQTNKDACIDIFKKAFEIIEANIQDIKCKFDKSETCQISYDSKYTLKSLSGNVEEE